ncbi:hypothetical protein EOI86_00905 [Hwanghaeella grinnelliae]|uniref:DUF2786 domain-containing protein n=1 Tax=Hwanghaeella grinnelliae TaxID=2500179 RepID=A0A3S2WT55_9PROT|nr:hypothetical protein [Hwanghaeella grinnelliae]RVU37895.1 hypothetical protein EOI86_00905 [Hwanghaeella grinnelliae]
MAQPLSDAEREKLRKIIGVMRSATIEGERKAAEIAATRLAKANGMTLEEAEKEAFPEEDNGRIDADERAAQQREAARWAANMVRMTEAYEASEKYRFMMAKEEAKRRGLEEQETAARARRTAPNRPRRYIPGKDDEFRLIAGLLRDGVSVERTAELVGVSTIDVARVWLLTRGKRAA